MASNSRKIFRKRAAPFVEQRAVKKRARIFVLAAGIWSLAGLPSNPVSAAPTEQVLYSFQGGSDGTGSQVAKLAIDRNGNLYGTTYAGGAENDGTVFQLSPPAVSGDPWTETVLHSFGTTPNSCAAGATDGMNPVSGVAIGADGTLYGTTVGGGNGSGTVFAINSPPSPGAARTESLIYCFTGESDGSGPYDAPLLGKGGTLFGTTIAAGGEVCGTSSCFGLSGTAFELTPPSTPGALWNETTLHGFEPLDGNGVATGDGSSSQAGLVGRTDGTLYGTTESGGSDRYGTAFQLVPPVSPGGAWTENVLYSFSGIPDGANPIAGLLSGVFGTTSFGGQFGDGTVFQLVPHTNGVWTEKILYSFGSVPDDGFDAEAGLIADKAGNLYGTTRAGGEPKAGTVFELIRPATATGSWTETILHSFRLTSSSDGANVYSGLVMGKDGTLYGTTYNGGTSGFGTVFSVKP